MFPSLKKCLQNETISKYASVISVAFLCMCWDRSHRVIAALQCALLCFMILGPAALNQKVNSPDQE